MKTLTDRLEERFVNEPTTGCWRWSGALNHGYGMISIGGKTRLAHRVAYEAFVGPIPDGMQIDHLCRARSCVNPAHLQPVSAKENVGRGISSNRRLQRCWRGHEFTPENTYRRNDRPGRMCRECHAERQRARRRSKRASTKPRRPTPEVKARPTPLDRFLQKYEVDSRTGCWMWVAAKSKTTGYGVFQVAGRWTLAHRAAYALFTAPLPDIAVIHHRCGVRACVNPEHLEAVSQRENAMASPTTVAAKNAVKIVCWRGHSAFKRDRSGHRYCTECNRLRQQAYRQRKET